MTYYPGIGGSFVADRTVRQFSTVRTRNNDAPDASFSLTWSELYDSSTGAIIVGNAAAYWDIGLKNLDTGKTFWAHTGYSGSGPISSSGHFDTVKATPALSIRKGDRYVVVCQSHLNYVRDMALPARIRFGGNLDVP